MAEIEKVSPRVKRANFMEPYKNNLLLANKLPELALKLLEAQFDLTIMSLEAIPITFTIGWKEILAQLRAEQAEECKVQVAGIQIEYLTEKSESDKSTNIVPQMVHVKRPLFQKKQKSAPVSGYESTDHLNLEYNAWKSVYAAEVIEAVENKVFARILNEYGINLKTAGAVYPILGAVYAAAIEFAKELKTEINVYDIYTVRVIEETNDIILKPLAAIKQSLKNDAKK